MLCLQPQVLKRGLANHEDAGWQVVQDRANWSFELPGVSYLPALHLVIWRETPQHGRELLDSIDMGDATLKLVHVDENVGGSTVELKHTRLVFPDPHLARRFMRMARMFVNAVVPDQNMAEPEQEQMLARRYTRPWVDLVVVAGAFAVGVFTQRWALQAMDKWM